MRGAGVDLELAGHRPAERSLGEHAADGRFDDALGGLVPQSTEIDGLEAAGETGVMMIQLGLDLVARHPHLLGVDHDDVVAGGSRRHGRVALVVRCRRVDLELRIDELTERDLAMVYG